MEVIGVKEVVYGSLLEAEKELADTLLLFLEFFPRDKLEKYTSIASRNLYPKDVEIRELSSVYDKLSKVRLLEHIENVVSELDKLYERFSQELGLTVHIGNRRIELDGFDYFILLISAYYHDVGKSPEVLKELGYSFEEYRKNDHAFWSGEYLKKVRREVEEFFGVEVRDDVFQRVYNAVVMHHSQVPKDKYGLVLKELDKKARERELHSMNSVLSVKEEKKYLSRDELLSITLPEELVNAFLEKVSSKSEMRKSGDVTYYFFYHPPYVYVNSLLVREILLQAIREKGIKIRDKNLVAFLTDKNNTFFVAQVLVKELIRKDLVKDVKEGYGGRYYLITERNGNEKLFFGIPIIAGNLKNFYNLKPSLRVVSVKPLKPEEVREIKALKH